MSIVSKWTIGAMASKKASASAPVASAIASASDGAVSGPVAMIAWSQSVGRQAGDFLARDGDQRMRLEPRRHGVRKSRRGRRRARRRPAPGCASPAAMISDPASRISACSSPTALVSASSERKELEQTSSARPSVLCASVPRTGRISCRITGTPACGDLPGGFRTGEAAADDVDGFELMRPELVPAGAKSNSCQRSEGLEQGRNFRNDNTRRGRRSGGCRFFGQRSGGGESWPYPSGSGRR